MTSLFETKNGSFEIKENQKSWTIKKIIDSDKFTIIIKCSKEDFKTLDEVKEFILKSL